MAVQSDVEYFARLVDALDRGWIRSSSSVDGHTASTVCTLSRNRSNTSLLEPSRKTSLSLSIWPLPTSRFARGCSKGTSVKN